MNTEQERADFEAWAKDGFHLQRGFNGDYRATITQIAWACWQAAYQAGRAALRSQTINEGWKEAAIAWDVCASIHRQYCKGKDPFFKTRQADFVKHAADSRNRAVADEALQSQDREDAERLDWLDSMNAKLNSYYGTTYRWEIVLSPHVVRLMAGSGGNGHVADIDLHDSAANGVPSCRAAIDHARRIEGEGK